MTTSAWRYIGIDWDSGAWIAVGYPERGHPETGMFERIEDLWETHGALAERVVVDVPIGLCEARSTPGGCVETDAELSRRCDDLARQLLGPRSSSVFTPPCRDAARAAAAGAEYAEVNETNKERTGKGLMRQAANIARGIVEVEELLMGPGDPTTVVEGHPELCYRAFGDKGLQFSKMTAPGVVERLSLLESTSDYDHGTWRRLASELGAEGHSTGLDDLLDALALAVTARAPSTDVHTLPADPPRDDEGLPVQMVYRRDEPFEVE